MNSISFQIQALAQGADELGRLEIQSALRETLRELQSPKDIMVDIMNSNMLYAILRVGSELGLFKKLSEHEGAMTVSQLAEATGASPELLYRVTRYLSSNNSINEIGVELLEANKLTHIFASDLGEGMIRHGFDVHGPVNQAMPSFLAANKYQDITSNTNTPFQLAHQTELQSFDWMIQHPEKFGSMQKVMTSFQGAEWTVGLDIFNDEAKKIPSTFPDPSETPFFVDVGGGHGHQCIQLAEKYSNLLGRLVLQDLPEAVNKLDPIKGVRAEAYDFFEKEPITEARFYYLRRIMHDWPDREASKILQNIAGAMNADSRILIDEIVVPDTGAHWEATMADLAMMNMCAGKERSKKQWLDLADQSGLRIEKIHIYIPSTYTSILVLALK